MSDPWVQTYYRGAAYPLELTQPAFGQDGTGCCLKVVDRLLDLCAQNIVRDARTTLAALKIIPTELSVNLMRAALTGNRDRSIHVLLSHWPYDVLRLESLAPPLFTSVLPLYNNTHLNYIARMGIRFTSTLAHYFAQCLKMKCNMKLKFLDITGFVTVDKVTDYIVSNCLLANNESRMKKISEALNALKEEGEAEGKPLPYNIDHTMSEGCYCVKFDVFVNSVNTHTELCKALHVCKFKSSSFKLLINKLDATFLGEVKLKVLLKLIDPEHLTALRLQFNSLGEHGIIHLSSSISSLTNLTALDLSCNGIHFFHSQDSCNQVAAMLASLPHLARLDLSNNRLKTRLRQLLCGLTRPLQYLAVVGCCLAVSDVTYLSLSHHTAGLTEIDLSENWSVGQNTRSLLTLLHALGEQIMVLEIQNCAMGDNELTELLAVLPSLTELRYLNLSFNDLCWDSSARCVRAGTRLSNFKALQLSYPRECHTELGDGEDAMTKENFKHQMTAIIQDQKNKTGVSFDFSLLDTY